MFRLKIVPKGEVKPIFCDLHDATANTLVEAKGLVSREAIRMAIGQIADYRPLPGDGVTPAVLVPEQPRADLLALLASQDVEAIWRTTNGFVDTRGGDLTSLRGVTPAVSTNAAQRTLPRQAVSRTAGAYPHGPTTASEEQSRSMTTSYASLDRPRTQAAHSEPIVS